MSISAGPQFNIDIAAGLLQWHCGELRFGPRIKGVPNHPPNIGTSRTLEA
jgi:hypothetical protein